MVAPPYPKIDNLYASLDGGEARAIGTLKRPERTQQIARWLCTEKIDGTNIRVSLEQSDDLAGALKMNSSWEVRFYGRRDKADTPDFVMDYLAATFKFEDLTRLWQCRRSCVLCGGTGNKIPVVEFGPMQVHVVDALRCPNVEPYPITLYGEVYGARVQKGGGDYRRDGDISFRLFDVRVGDHWLTWANVVSIAHTVGVKTVPLVPVVERGSPAMAVSNPHAVIADIVDQVHDGFMSFVAQAEGTPRLAEGIVARTDPYLFDNNGRRVVFKTKTKDY